MPDIKAYYFTILSSLNNYHSMPCTFIMKCSLCNSNPLLFHSQFGETPLHFACKLGHTEIVALLMSLPLTSTTIKNKEGKTPAEIICQKKPSPKVKTKIEELLAGIIIQWYNCFG